MLSGASRLPSPVADRATTQLATAEPGVVVSTHLRFWSPCDSDRGPDIHICNRRFFSVTKKRFAPGALSVRYPIAGCGCPSCRENRKSCSEQARVLPKRFATAGFRRLR